MIYWLGYRLTHKNAKSSYKRIGQEQRFGCGNREIKTWNIVDRANRKQDQKQSRTLESDCQVKLKLTTEQSQVDKLRSGIPNVRVRRAVGSTMIQAHRLRQGGARDADHQLRGDGWGSLTSGYPADFNSS